MVKTIISGDMEVVIHEHLGIIEKYSNGWTKEINIVAWNGNDPKIDIRDWSPNHERMSRGLTFAKTQAKTLRDILIEKL